MDCYIEKEAGWASRLLGTGALAAMGAGSGNVVGSAASIPFSMRGLDYASREPVVSTIDYVRRNAPGDVRAITPDSLRYGQTRFSRQEAKGLKSALKSNPSTAFYAHPQQRRGRGAKIIAADNSSPSILAHEVGHHRERLKNPGWRLTVLRERDAWRMAPAERGPYFRQAKKNLLRGYKAQAAGTGGGALFGIGMALRVFKKSNRGRIIR